MDTLRNVLYRVNWDAKDILHSQEQVVNCYYAVADNYMVDFDAELFNNHFNQMLLKAVASASKKLIIGVN